MHKFAEKIAECVKSKVEAVGIDNVSCADLKEIGEWVDIAKDLTEYDKNMRVIKAMDESEEEERVLSRMGYDRYRYADGRFAPKDRGTRMGYMMPYPYLHMQDDDWMEEYLHNPDFEKNMYRMGYHPDRGDMRMDGMNRQASRHGEIYDRYSDYRRHYRDSKDADSKRKMDDSMKEYTSDIIRNLTEMWSDADATLRQSMKTDLTRLVQQMN